MTLESVLSTVTASEARAIYDALAQWADNERNGIEESDTADPEHIARVSLVENVVGRLEVVFASLA